MDDERIDFSELDPARDPARWERLIKSVAQRAVAANRRRLTVSRQLQIWALPALALAAGLSLVAWAGALMRPQTQQTSASTDSATALATWAEAEADELPSTSTLVQVLGEDNGNQ